MKEVCRKRRRVPGLHSLAVCLPRFLVSTSASTRSSTVHKALLFLLHTLHTYHKTHTLHLSHIITKYKRITNHTHITKHTHTLFSTLTSNTQHRYMYMYLTYHTHVTKKHTPLITHISQSACVTITQEKKIVQLQPLKISTLLS